MSVKRQATTELNHENWDQEDEVDQEEGTGFKMASKEVLEKRVIRTAKRRTHAASDEAKKTVFSAFGGFNKTQKSSFDFLANLTNGSKVNNNATFTTESETTSSSNNTKLATSPTTGGFGLTGTSTPLTKFTFGIQKSESSLFSGTTTPAFSQSLFNSKVGTAEKSNPFQIQTSPNSATNFISKPSGNLDKPIVSQGFGDVTTSVFSKSLFTPKLGTSENSSPFKTESMQNTKLTTDLKFTPSTNATNPVVSPGFGGAAFSPSMLSSKPEATASSAPFKIQSSPSSTFKTDSVSPSANADKLVVSQSQVFGGNTSSPFSKSLFSSNPGNSIPAVSTTTNKPVVSEFGGVATSVFAQKMFSAKLDTSGNSSPFKIQSTQSSTLTSPSANSEKLITSQGSTVVFGKSESNNADTLPKSGDTKLDEASLIYFNSVKNLNKSLLDWIQKHVEKSPLCYLTPVFNDYEKHLQRIYAEYTKNVGTNEDSTVVPPKSLNLPSESNSTKISTDTPSSSEKTENSSVNVNTLSPFGSAGAGSGFSFGLKYPIGTSTHPSSDSNSTKISTDASSTSNKTGNSPGNVNTLTSLGGSGASSGFSFGLKYPIGNTTHPPTESNSTKVSTVTTSTTDKTGNSAVNVISLSPFGGSGAGSGFSFGLKNPTEKSSPFTNNLPATSVNSKTPFSFGTGKPFSFNSNVKKSEESVNEAVDNEDVPPKVEYTPIVEENSVFDKKCKVFVKKDGNFADKGVGTLYIKKIEESGKYQVLVRANTTLGTVLLNFVLSSSITTQRMGKNNVMMVCIPTPDAKPPPTPILVRVKTSEEADQLLETLDKYKA